MSHGAGVLNVADNVRPRIQYLGHCRSEVWHQTEIVEWSRRLRRFEGLPFETPMEDSFGTCFRLSAISRYGASFNYSLYTDSTRIGAKQIRYKPLFNKW